DSLQAVVPPGKVQKDPETPPAAELASRADHELRMVSEAAARDPNKTLCGRCLREVQIGEAVMKTKSRSPKYICKTCNKVGSTLSRRLHGWPLPCWNSLSSTEQSQFWRSVCEQHDSAHGTLQYEKIKGLLTDVFERKVRSVTSHACTGPFLPLSVWESRGYELEPIRAKAESREDDLFGTVYRVATLETGVKHEEEDVRSIIQKAERHVRKRKAEQSAGPEACSDDGDSPKAAAPCKEDEFHDWESISSDEPTGKDAPREPKSAAKKAAKAKPKAKATPEQRAFQRQAQKTVQDLERLQKEAAKLVAKSAVPIPTLQGAAEAAKCCLQDAQAVLKGKSTSLSFQKKDVQKIKKDLDSALQEQKNLCKALKAMGAGGLHALAAAAAKAAE
ncbi:unnamed protein product, partial [Effrenium voratum]